MSAPLKPVRDATLAGDFARKCYGKFGTARVRKVKIPSAPGRSFTVYEVGVCSQVGDFVPKGDSSHDFAEAFDRAGYPMDARDPLFSRHEMKQCNAICTPKPEQVEIAL
jgi:hypothetical protein